eukprot:c25922_g1_i1 orf=813-1304(-)
MGWYSGVIRVVAIRAMVFVLCYHPFPLVLGRAVSTFVAPYPEYAMRLEQQQRTPSSALLGSPQQPLVWAPTPAPSRLAPAPFNLSPHVKSKPSRRHRIHTPLPPMPSNGNEKGRITGFVFIAVAGLLQVAIVSFLLAKRRQMLKVVRNYEYEHSDENSNAATS